MPWEKRTHEDRNTEQLSGSMTTWKARDATKDAKKRGNRSIVQRWQLDEKYQASQTARGWTEDYWRHLDYLATVDIWYVVTWNERSRYENSLVLKVNVGQLPGPIKDREDCSQGALVLAALQRQKGWVNPFIPKNERERHWPFDEELRSNHVWQSWNWNVNQSQASSSSLTTWWQSGKWHEPQQNNGKTNNGGKSCDYSLSDPSVFWQESCTFVVFFRVQTSANVVHATGWCRQNVVASTERDTDAHFFSCHAHVTDMKRTCVWLLHMWIVCLRVLIKSHSFVSCFGGHCLSHTSLRAIRSHHFALHFFPTQTPNSPSVSAESFDESKTLCHSARRHAVRPNEALSQLKPVLLHGNCVRQLVFFPFLHEQVVLPPFWESGHSPLLVCIDSIDWHSPGGLADSASSHLISSHLISSHLIRCNAPEGVHGTFPHAIFFLKKNVRPRNVLPRIWLHACLCLCLKKRNSRFPLRFQPQFCSCLSCTIASDHVVTFLSLHSSRNLSMHGLLMLNQNVAEPRSRTFGLVDATWRLQDLPTGLSTCSTVTWTGDPAHSMKLVDKLNFGGAKGAATPATAANDPHSV